MKHRFNVKMLKETDSTNLLMQEWEKAGKLKHGDVFCAVNQLNGIGQRGNIWESENGKNLTFSLFLQTHFLDSSELFQINKIISLAVFDYLVEKKIESVKIKWPNDIYVGDKKIAGMLTHNSFLGDKLEYSIVGLGLNINQMQFISDAPNPISLKQILGMESDLKQELNAVLDKIQIRFDQLVKSELGLLNTDYLKHLYGFQKMRQFKDSKNIFEGKITGVDSYGCLQIIKDSKTLVVYDVKEIEFI